MVMRNQVNGQAGFSLIETLISLGVLTTGALGLAAVFAQGVRTASTSPFELVAIQKASEAVESVFTARDSHTITWAQLRNRNDGGIFLDGSRRMYTAGADAVLNTGDDGEVLEGAELDRFTREIKITDINDDLRAITVTIEYPAGTTTRTYTLVAYISAYA